MGSRFLIIAYLTANYNTYCQFHTKNRESPAKISEALQNRVLSPRKVRLNVAGKVAACNFQTGIRHYMKIAKSNIVGRILVIDQLNGKSCRATAC